MGKPPDQSLDYDLLCVHKLQKFIATLALDETPFTCCAGACPKSLDILGKKKKKTRAPASELLSMLLATMLHMLLLFVLPALTII